MYTFPTIGKGCAGPPHTVIKTLVSILGFEPRPHAPNRGCNQITLYRDKNLEDRNRIELLPLSQ